MADIDTSTDFFTFDKALAETDAAPVEKKEPEKVEKAIEPKKEEGKLVKQTTGYDFEQDPKDEESQEGDGADDSETEITDPKKEGVEGEGKVDAKKEESLKPPKKLKAKVGDEVIDIDPRAVILQKVDGVDREVSIREMADSFSSREVNQREYRKAEMLMSEASNKEKSVTGVLTNFSKRLEAGEVVPAVMELIEFRGGNPLAAIKNLREGLLKEAQALIDLGEDGRQQLYDAEEREYYKQLHVKAETEKTTKAEQATLLGKVDQAVKDFGFPDRNAFFELVNEVETYAKNMVASGKLKKYELTPQTVGEYYQAKQQQSLLNEVLSVEAPQVAKDENSEDYIMFAKHCREYNPTKKQLESIIKKYYGESDAGDNGKGNRSSSKDSKAKKDRNNKAGGKSATGDFDLDGIEPLESF